MFKELLAIIESNDKIVIFGHPNPDGDCYGSQISLRDAIRINYPNKQVYAVGSGYRRFFKLFGPMDKVDDDFIKDSLGILLDGNDVGRMEDQRVRTAKELIKIDHHIENGKFTQGKFVVDDKATSTSQLIIKLIQEAQWNINPRIADALYLGVVTDTGRFQYIDDFEETFEEATWLCKQGANPKAINKILNATQELSMVFKGYVFSHYQKSKNGVLYVSFSKEKLAQFHISAVKANTMVNLIANVEGFPIWVFFAECEDGTCRMEIRSNGPIVQPIAAHYDGGGHALAAGATLSSFNNKIIKEVIDLCDNAISEYNKE